MEKYHSCLLLSLFLLVTFSTRGDDVIKKQEFLMDESIPTPSISLHVEVNERDTFCCINLREVIVFPPLEFKNKREERFYWRTVRDVKKTLPYAKIVSSELIATNRLLINMSDDKERKTYLEQYEKELFKKYEKDIRNMTFSQGKMLLKLIDREVDRTSYDLIKYYRGGFSAFFWQGIAKIFGADLKTSYDTTKDEDRIIERVIILVEAGQL